VLVVKSSSILIAAAVRMQQTRQLVLLYGHGEQHRQVMMHRIELYQNAVHAAGQAVKFWHGAVTQIKFLDITT
jgi:hypothetical protein